MTSRLDFYRARVVDGLGRVIHERLFAIELSALNRLVLRRIASLRWVKFLITAPWAQYLQPAPR
jgi:hypothetical protein